MGCFFCHNPETWDVSGGQEMGGADLMRHLERFRTFFQEPALTISGGEPLFQPEFTLELIHRAKALGWHVAVDTSAWGPPEPMQKICDAADLVIFSIKHPLMPEKLAPGADLRGITANLGKVAASKIRLWLRYVLIPGWTDSPECLKQLGGIAQELPNLDKLEILPFNNLAAEKWVQLGKNSPIFNGSLHAVSEEQIGRAEEWLVALYPGLPLR